MNVLKVSDLGLDLVKHFEGLYLQSYLCPAGVWTIGYGHTLALDGKPIREGMVIDEQRANELLADDLAGAETAVNALALVPLWQAQFDALVSFAFNCGGSALKHSTLLRVLNRGKYEDVPAQLRRWNKARDPKTGKMVVLAGLTRRRAAESWLFEHGCNRFDF